MTMDEHGEDSAPQVVARFNVSDCSVQPSVSSEAAVANPPSSWSILQRDLTFGAGWPGAFYARVREGAEPSFAVTPPPISTRMHYVMEGIFAAVVVPEYAQLMGINMKAAANEDADGGRGAVDDYKYIPVATGYGVGVVSSFAFPVPATATCPTLPPCGSSAASSPSTQNTCESSHSSARNASGRRAVVTLITSDSYLHGALLLLCARPHPLLLSLAHPSPRDSSAILRSTPLTPLSCPADTAYCRMAACRTRNRSPSSLKKCLIVSRIRCKQLVGA
jgi:hypothetical protein